MCWPRRGLPFFLPGPGGAAQQEGELGVGWSEGPSKAELGLRALQTAGTSQPIPGPILPADTQVWV